MTRDQFDVIVRNNVVVGTLSNCRGIISPLSSNPAKTLLIVAPPSYQAVYKVFSLALVIAGVALAYLWSTLQEVGYAYFATGMRPIVLASSVLLLTMLLIVIRWAIQEDHALVVRTLVRELSQTKEINQQ